MRFAVFKQTWDGAYQRVKVITRDAVSWRVYATEHAGVTRKGAAWHHRPGFPRDRTAGGQRVDRRCIGLLERIGAAAIDGKEQNPAALRVTRWSMHRAIVPMPVRRSVCA